MKEKILKLFSGVKTGIKKIKLKMKSRKQKKHFHMRWQYFLAFFLLLIFVFYFLILKDLPSPSKLAKYDIPLATKLYDRNGKILYEIFAEQKRSLVTLSEIPQDLKDATIAIEDKDFYQHKGINPIGGILRAVKNIIVKRRLEGGSTITQQLIKSALLTPERTIQRKVKEIIIATWAEIIYSKDQILEMYFNQVPYGGTARGVEAAA